jgi:AcrR family transcriptional regulator
MKRREVPCADSNAGPPPARARTPSSEVRNALVAAAVRVIERDGRAGLTVRAVAAEADVAPMGVYNHLQGKSGLLVAVLASGFDGLTAAVTWDSIAEPESAFLGVGRRYRRFALGRPVTYGLMFGGGVPAEVHTQIAEHAGPAFEALLDTVRHAQRAGIVRPGETEPLARSTWSAVHGAVSLEIASEQPADAGEAIYEVVLRMIIDGLAPR